MFSAMTDFVSWLLTDCLPDFLTAEPIVYILGFALFGYVVSLVIKFLHY